MSDDLSSLPLRDADQRAREQIEHHRAQMRAWKRRRAHRIATARQSMSVEEIASELRITPPTVYELLQYAREKPEPSPEA